MQPGTSKLLATADKFSRMLSDRTCRNRDQKKARPGSAKADLGQGSHLAKKTATAHESGLRERPVGVLLTNEQIAFVRSLLFGEKTKGRRQKELNAEARSRF